jgi:hypothetical protein
VGPVTVLTVERRSAIPKAWSVLDRLTATLLDAEKISEVDFKSFDYP